MIETISPSLPLVERLRERIRTSGPISFCDWMRSALYDQHDGYYCRPDRNKWGREGDYRTSPERSSLFAATFARYFAKLYNQLDRPSHWTIAEAGAGGEAEGVVLAAVGSLGRGGAAELPAPDDQRVLKKAARLEVLQ